MGCCFSSQPQAASTPASYAAAALHAAANIIDPTASSSPSPTGPTPSPAVKQVIPNAHVFKMPDGDTFTCRHSSPSGAPLTSRVRVLGIDCPETRQNYGPEAAQLGRTLLADRVVTLHVHTTDRYGRLVADVFLPDGRSFAHAMLAAGAAWHYKDYDKRDHLAALERDARAARRGLWQFPRPLEPWEYRKRLRNSAK